MKTTFKVFHEEEYGNKPYIIGADSTEDAAIFYAQNLNTMTRGECFAGGNEITVQVENEDGSLTTFDIIAEVTTEYFAHER